MLHSVVADYAFIGADAMDPEFGVASRTLEQSRLKTLMMQRARQIVVSSPTAQGQHRPVQLLVAEPARWRLITDDAADPAALDALRSQRRRTDRHRQPLRVLANPTTRKAN